METLVYARTVWPAAKATSATAAAAKIECILIGVSFRRTAIRRYESQTYSRREKASLRADAFTLQSRLDEQPGRIPRPRRRVDARQQLRRPCRSGGSDRRRAASAAATARGRLPTVRGHQPI